MDEYIKSLLAQISESYNFLKERRDEPGDLDIIKVHLGKIQGVIKVLCNKIEALHTSSDSYFELLKLGRSYLQNYDFNKVIEAYETYSEDISRIKNIRISILSSLEETKFIFKIQSMLRDLDS
jgi:hypothetical protein